MGRARTGARGYEQASPCGAGPRSLWAPISFTQTALALDEKAGGTRFSSDDWRDWWCADDAKVYQFIGQDNIYFYCVAQPALWDALDWGLFQDTPVANYHILFMNKKAAPARARYARPWQPSFSTTTLPSSCVATG